MIINVNPRGLLITCNSYILKTGQQHHKAQGARGLLYDIDDIADHFPTGRAMDLDLNIQGAPNFRAPNEESLNVFGVCLLCLLSWLTTNVISGGSANLHRLEVYSHPPWLSAGIPSQTQP